MSDGSDADGHLLGVETGFPFVFSAPTKTPKGTPYLRTPGVHLISKPAVNLDSVQTFLAGFNPDLEFGTYLSDPEPEGFASGAKLIKFAGQSCYASFGPKRTKNKDASKYLDHIKESYHGSTNEHANYSFFIYGVSRSLTHEMVRHRSGWGFSQLSQRFVNGSVLRFVERPEYNGDPVLHQDFEESIDAAAARYAFRADRLLQLQANGEQLLSAERKTELRKKVQQTARSCLPNETETFLVATANARALRHVCEMRAASSADIEIRELFMRIFRCLRVVEPMLFNDYTITQLDDGTEAVSTPYRKI